MKMFAILAAFGLMTVATTAPAAAQVNQRQDAQQHRIRQGVRSGELTRREASNLQRQQRNIRHTENRMRSSGGRLTNRERQRLDQRQNRASNRIYRQKNDRQDRRW